MSFKANELISARNIIDVLIDVQRNEHSLNQKKVHMMKIYNLCLQSKIY